MQSWSVLRYLKTYNVLPWDKPCAYGMALCRKLPHIHGALKSLMLPLRRHSSVSACTEYSRTFITLQNWDLSVENNKALQTYVSNVVAEYQWSLEKLEGKSSVEQEVDLKSIQQKLQYLQPIAVCVQELQKLNCEVQELQQLLADSTSDKEMLELAECDRSRCEETIKFFEEKLMSLILPPEPLDLTNVIIEVTAGVGGLEAMLFAQELFEMYVRYACWKGWQCEVMEQQFSELDVRHHMHIDMFENHFKATMGTPKFWLSDSMLTPHTHSGLRTPTAEAIGGYHYGLRHGCLWISGMGAYAYLKFEGGVHRVQRVPQTEKSGRIHTSTAAVAVLPQPVDIEVNLDPKDIKVETKRSSGAGGQHVNKTDSAVRLTHIPTGIVVECQKTRSQIQNRMEAMRRLQAKLYQMQYEKQLNEQQSSRKIQIGTSGRSEKIRTYNFLQDRITDHRLEENVHNLVEFMKGEQALDAMLDSLSKELKREILVETIKRNN